MEKDPPNETRVEIVRHVVCRVAELPVGHRRIVTVGNREIGVLNVGGKFYALLNRCPHLGGPLCEGETVSLVKSEGPGDLRLDESRPMLTCPWHGWEFDIRTGQSYADPRRMRARPFPVAVERRDEHAAPQGMVPGPFRADVVPVSVEEDYIVVRVRTVTEQSEVPV